MIEFSELSKVYPGDQEYALKNINLTINTGEFIFIVGKSGAGKSTLIKLLLKEIDPSEGSLSVFGKRLSEIKERELPYYRRNIGVVFQDYRLLENKTVYENVAFAMEIVGTNPKVIARVTPKVLNLVGLRDKSRKYPLNLSGGEQQRIAIARSIINSPKILICDEPTGNLDPVTSAGIMNLLSDINNSGTTIVIATHDITMVDRMKKRVVSLQDGKIVSDRVGGYYK